MTSNNQMYVAFEYWDVVKVTKDPSKWTIHLVNRSSDLTKSSEFELATVTIQKMTLAELQTTVLSDPSFRAHEGLGISVVTSEQVYMTRLETEQLYTTDKKLEEFLVGFQGKEDHPNYAKIKKQFEESYAKGLEWSTQLSNRIPLEDYCVEETEGKLYFGLPEIVYVHMVGQLMTPI
jgi:hypothetical protein